MKDRLQELLKKENISYARFADIIDVQRSSISHILSGRNKPSFDFIQKIILNFPKINAEWLITGKGEMYKSKVTQNDLFSTNHTIMKEEVVPENNKKSEQKIPEVTNVNNVKKLIILYNDNSFEEFSPR